MLQKDEPKVFDDLTPELLVAYYTLIEALASASILHLPHPHQLCSIDTNKLDYQIGCDQIQRDEENIRCPIVYFIQTLQAVKWNYSTKEKECFTVV